MTVETLKPFIKVPVESGESKRPNGSKTALVCHSIVLAIFYAGLLGFVIWNSVRVANLQKEVKHLNLLLDTMQKRLGFDLLDLNEFEEAYGHSVSAEKIIPDKSFFNMDDDQDEYDPELNDMEVDDEDYMDDELLGGSSEEEDLSKAANETYKIDLDSSLYDDLDEDLDDYEYGLDIGGNSDENSERKTRSIVARNGVPVVDEPYSAKDRPAEGQGAVKPTMKYDWNEKRQQYLERKYKKYMEIRSKPANMRMEQGKDGDSNQNNHPTQQDKAASYPGQVVLTGTRRRVARPVHKSLEGRGRHRSVAVHYVGDTSRYIPGHHRHYEGNGRLRHTGGVYVDWAVDPSISNSNQFFRMENGIVTVQETGIYLIYAQLFYHDDHDTNGFRIEKNGVPFLICTTMTHSVDRVTKSNTCFTSGVTLLKADDNIRISDLAYDRHVILDPVRSFFGLVKLGAHTPIHGTHHQSHEDRMRMLDTMKRSPKILNITDI
ncbi:protein eiger isoform X2 [Hermetia illucens]|uniref:protein eiger isoform X2 n=1 Tax=Hermetia illucens TaxID=343691 RepID=UPI0018CC41CD|nr:protein eiger isoform X2 [Hermetia illucens]